METVAKCGDGVRGEAEEVVQITMQTVCKLIIREVIRELEDFGLLNSFFLSKSI